jgi:glycosyltransferase involved in cell wall biosynthesis
MSYASGADRLSAWSAEFEALRTRNGLVHGWGRVRGACAAPARAWLEIRGADGELCAKIPSAIGKQRAAGGGVEVDLVLYGPLKRPLPESMACTLVLELADGLQARLPVPRPEAISSAKDLAGLLSLPWKHYFLRGMQLVRYGEVGPLFRKMWNMTQTLLASGRNADALLKLAAASGNPLALIIDHDLGGGANLFRNGFAKRLEAEGLVPVLLTAQHGMLAYQLQFSERGRIRLGYERSLEDLFAALAKADFTRVVFNNIVSFPDPCGLVKALSGLLAQGRAGKFLFLLHDYYSVCPAWLLLDDGGSYCGVPDAARCDTCLPRNATPFLDFSATLDIRVWRQAWLTLLRHAEEVRCFSGESRKILIKAHPALLPEKITVVPHALEHVRLTKVRLQDRGAPVVGIVGNIVRAKGSRVVRDLARHIKAAGLPVRLVIIGTIDEELDADVANVTGPYRPDQLPALVEAHGVNVGFFPSVWPETFSYVAQEMMEMGLPVLAFALGAPMERIGGYERGATVELGGPDVILAGVQSLYRTHVQTAKTS